jgi:hypothetical protein
MARPKKEQREARTERLNLRFSPEEWGEIDAKARAAGLSPTEFCRLAALGQRVEAAPVDRAPVSPAGVAHVVALNRVGVNLNQIARALNSDLGIQPRELENSLHRVNQLLDTWQGTA